MERFFGEFEVRNVDRKYKGYGDKKQLVGYTVACVFEWYESEWDVTFDLPGGRRPPVVGDVVSVEISVVKDRVSGMMTPVPWPDKFNGFHDEEPVNE